MSTLPPPDKLRQVLHASPVFGQLPELALEALLAQLRLSSLQAGELVLREGEPGKALFIVVQGRLRVTRTGADGQLQLFNELGPGESHGEAWLMLRQNAAADVSALRDSCVAWLDEAGFEAVLQQFPVAFNRVFSQALVRYLRHTPPPPAQRRAHTLAVLPLAPMEGFDDFLRQLQTALQVEGEVHWVPPSQGQSELGLALAMRQFEQWEQSNEVLLLQGEAQFSAWTRFVLRQADHLVLVAPAGLSPVVGALERKLRAEAGFAYKRQQLVLLHGAHTLLPQPMRPWLQGRDELERALPLRAGHAADAARLARLLMGHAVGVVLGGGGARGFAHLGVLRALREAGIPVDLIGGNSMGALIGSQLALGYGHEDIVQRVRDFAANGERPTLPMVSLLSGRRMESGLRRLCLLGGHDAQIDALWTPFFAAACNLSRACTTVLEQGPLWRAVMASNSPAGLLPPVPVNGDLLVDGAILDNVPVEAMRQRLGARLEKRRGNGTVIAIDVDVAEPMQVRQDLKRLGARAKLQASFSNAETLALPSIGQILYRASHIGGMVQRGRTLALSDFHLEPPTQDFALMAYKRANEIVDCGYRYAQQQIAQWDRSLLPRAEA